MSYDDLRDYGDDPYTEGIVRSRAEAEYQRGVSEMEEAQAAGPPGSPAREAAFREMELRAEREGDGY